MFKLEGRRLGRYQLGERLGQGGMGMVYSARADGEAGEVAVKLLFGAFTDDPEFLRRLHREAEVMASLEHPHIVRLLELGEEPGVGPYLAMQRAPGRDLRHVLDQAPMPLPRALEHAAQVADALAHAHQRGIAHRDIKPENLVVDAEGRIMVTDFGIARAVGGSRATRTGFIPGTPEYMAPEQFGQGAVGTAADVYSLGLVLYEMLTGLTPFRSDNVAEVIQRQVYQLPAAPSLIRPEVGPDLDRLVLACLAKAPEARPAARDVAAELRRLELAPPALPAPAGPQSIPTVQVPVRTEPPRRPSVLRFVPLVLLAAAVVLLALAWQRILRPPSWFEDGAGVAPAPLTRVLAGGATLHGAEFAVFVPGRTASGLERARAVSNALASVLRQGAPGPVRGRKDGKEWVVETEGGTELFRVDLLTAAHLGATPSLAGSWWTALLKDHLAMREGTEPEHALAFERKHPLRPDRGRPVGPVFDRVFRRARHQVREGPLPTWALVEAVASLEEDDRKAFREAARVIPREIPKGADQ